MAKKTRRHITTLIILIAGVVLIGGGVFIILRVHSSNPNIISKQILDEANFTIFYPNSDAKSVNQWQLQKDRSTYDKESGVLSLHAVQKSTGREIVLNEQPTPGAFNDVPTQYSRMLTSLNEYNELQLSFGTVALTHPEELKGAQAAVANKAGTLIFAKPSANLSDDEWKTFFENLRIVR